MKLIFMNDIGVNKDSANLMSFYVLKEFYPYEVWDLSGIYGAKGTVKNIDECIPVNTIEDFEKMLAKTVREMQVVIITNMVEIPWRRLQPIARKYAVPVVCTQKNNFFDILRSQIALDFSIKIPWNYRIGYIVWKYRIGRIIYSKLTHSDAKFDYLISAYNSKPETVKHFVRGHNVKYDEYLMNINSANPIGSKYILFIDSSLYYHPIDFKKDDPNFNGEHYLSELNHYFEMVEEKYSLPVVIALHPVSAERLNSESFNGRKTLYGCTTQLIHHAEFVLSHYSTSLVNAVLAYKPVIILSSEEIEHSLRRRQQSWAFAFAKMCGFENDRLDNAELKEPRLDKRKYSDFINKYLVDTEQKDKSNSDIIHSLLKRLETENK